MQALHDERERERDDEEHGESEARGPRTYPKEQEGKQWLAMRESSSVVGLTAEGPRNPSPPGPAGDARNPSPRKGRSRTDTMVYSEAANVVEELAKGEGFSEADLDRAIAHERMLATVEQIAGPIIIRQPKPEPEHFAAEPEPGTREDAQATIRFPESDAPRDHVRMLLKQMESAEPEESEESEKAKEAEDAEEEEEGEEELETSSLPAEPEQEPILQPTGEPKTTVSESIETPEPAPVEIAIPAMEEEPTDTVDEPEEEKEFEPVSLIDVSQEEDPAVEAVPALEITTAEETANEPVLENNPERTSDDDEEVPSSVPVAEEVKTEALEETEASASTHQSLADHAVELTEDQHKTDIAVDAPEDAPSSPDELESAEEPVELALTASEAASTPSEDTPSSDVEEAVGKDSATEEPVEHHDSEV